MITKEEATELQRLIAQAVGAAHDLEAMEQRASDASWKLDRFVENLQQPAPPAPRKSRAKQKAAA